MAARPRRVRQPRVKAFCADIDEHIRQEYPTHEYYQPTARAKVTLQSLHEAYIKIRDYPKSEGEQAYIEDPATTQFLRLLLLFLADDGKIPQYEMTFSQCVETLWQQGFRDLHHVVFKDTAIIQEEYGLGLALSKDAAVIAPNQLVNVYFGVCTANWMHQPDNERVLVAYCKDNAHIEAPDCRAGLANAPFNPDDGNAVQGMGEKSSAQIVLDCQQGAILEDVYGLLHNGMDLAEVKKRYLRTLICHLQIQTKKAIYPGESIWVDYTGGEDKFFSEWGKPDGFYGVRIDPQDIPDGATYDKAFLWTTQGYKAIDTFDLKPADWQPTHLHGINTTIDIDDFADMVIRDDFDKFGLLNLCSDSDSDSDSEQGPNKLCRTLLNDRELERLFKAHRAAREAMKFELSPEEVEAWLYSLQAAEHQQQADNYLEERDAAACKHIELLWNQDQADEEAVANENCMMLD